MSSWRAPVIDAVTTKTDTSLSAAPGSVNLTHRLSGHGRRLAVAVQWDGSQAHTLSNVTAGGRLLTAVSTFQNQGGRTQVFRTVDWEPPVGDVSIAVNHNGGGAIRSCVIAVVSLAGVERVNSLWLRTAQRTDQDVSSPYEAHHLFPSVPEERVLSFAGSSNAGTWTTLDEELAELSRTTDGNAFLHVTTAIGGPTKLMTHTRSAFFAYNLTTISWAARLPRALRNLKSDGVLGIHRL